MNWIEHIVEPQKLILTWQAANQLRLFVGELIRKGDACDLVYLVNHPEYQQALKEGFEGYPAFPLGKEVYQNVMNVFSRRIPQRSRGDFDAYLQSLRIKPGAQISNFALLGYSGAKLPDDWFFIFHPFEHVSDPCEMMTLVAGFRHYLDAVSLLNENHIPVGSRVTIEQEPENKFDADSIKVVFNEKKIGNLNRGFLPSANEWIKQKRIISAVVERINGDSEHPKVYIFLKVGAK